MAAAKAALKRPGASGPADKSSSSTGGRQMTCAQKIEAATIQKSQAVLSDQRLWDAEALFWKYDSEQTGLLSRGALAELLREIGLEKKQGASFAASTRLAFDSHSADSHFLALPEFKQLYYYISTWHPELLPRDTMLKITIMKAKDIPATDANGKSDPFCTVMCCRLGPDGKLEPKPWSKSTTVVKEKNLSPWWGEDFTDKYGFEPGGVKCPNDHDLKCFETQSEKSCSVCGSEAAQGATMHGCKECTYDICTICKEEGDKEHPGDSLLFQLFDWDKGDRNELIARAVLPSTEFYREGGFNSTLPMQCLVSDAPRGCVPMLKVRVMANNMPETPPRLRVKIHRSRGLPPVDPNGKSDPFCTFQIVGKPFSQSQTKHCNRTLEPVWDEEFDGKYRYEDGDDLTFEVLDYNKSPTAKYELLGRCTLPNKAFATPGGFHGEVSLTDVARGSVLQSSGRPYSPHLRLSVFLADRVVTLKMKVEGADMKILSRKPGFPEFEAGLRTVLASFDKSIDEKQVLLDFAGGGTLIRVQIMIQVTMFQKAWSSLTSARQELCEPVAELLQRKLQAGGASVQLLSLEEDLQDDLAQCTLTPRQLPHDGSAEASPAGGDVSAAEELPQA